MNNDDQEASEKKPRQTRRSRRSRPADKRTASQPSSASDRVGSDTQAGPDNQAGTVRRRRLIEADPVQTGPTLPPPPQVPPPSATPPSEPPPPTKPQIGDSRPAANSDLLRNATPPDTKKRSGRRSRNKAGANRAGANSTSQSAPPVEAILADEDPIELDEKQIAQRRGSQRDGKPLGRYRMYVSVKDDVTHVAITEGRVLIEHYVNRPDEEETTKGNIYLGQVVKVVPGIEMAFLDIGSDKHGVIHSAGLRGLAGIVDPEGDPTDNIAGVLDPDISRSPGARKLKDAPLPRIEQVLRPGQKVLCQVRKRPIAHKGSELTTALSLPGRFVVLIPNSSVKGASRMLDTRTTKRLRNTMQRFLPKNYGAIARTAAQHAGPQEIKRDIERLVQLWEQTQELSQRVSGPSLLFKEPEKVIRILREEFNSDYREVVIDDQELYEKVRSYMSTISTPSLDRIVYYDTAKEKLPLLERYQIPEQLRKAVDRKVWLPSGGSLIIEHTEALTVIDVNTGKNTGSNSLAETLYLNNLEAAEEIARQLRLRDIGGIIVIDFVDMESKREREQLTTTLRKALQRDKTPFSIEPVSSYGVVQMTRQRVGEGLLESVTHTCADCSGRGLILEEDLVSA